MRRLFLLLAAVLVLLCLPTTADASVVSPKTGIFATVSPDGSCQVTMTVSVTLTQQTEDLVFPIPGDATGVTLNGSRANTTREGNLRYVKLNKLLAHSMGEVSFTVHYSLQNVVHTTENGTLELRLPLLSGFEGAVENLEFSVSLPGNIENLPGFESGYHQRSIEQDLTYRIDGAMITGNSLATMKDHETLVLLLDVSETMFPQSFVKTRDYSWGSTAMTICTLLALVYWLIFLRSVPLQRQWCTEPPEGRTAGELGSVLHLQGTDLTMCVLSWARLGYVLLQLSRGGRVLIHKRMEMGSERKNAEQRLFNALFAKSDVVDTASARYARLCLETAKRPMAIQELIKERSGNPVVFRGLAAGIGLFGGVTLAISLSEGAFLMGLMILVLGALGAASGWYIQLWGSCLMIRNPNRLTACLCICGVWLLLGLIAGSFGMVLWMLIRLLLAGLLLSWGGRRTEQGKLEVARILGLRQYLRHASREDLQRLCQEDPAYFFDLAPCAIALGLDKVYANRFAKIRFEECPYLLMENQSSKNAKEWTKLLKKLVAAMDDRARQLPWQKFLNKRK